MSRVGQILVVTAAWLLPVAWVSAALLAGPSDGTLLSSSTLERDPRWGEGLVVVAQLGGGPLEAGDLVVAIDGRPVDDWASGRVPSPDRVVGETVTYQVLRERGEVDLSTVREVTLRRYPVLAGLADGAAAVTALVLVLGAATALFWRRPGRVEGALLAGSSLLPASLTSAPLGLGVVDLAGARGTWPRLGGELVASLGLGFLLLAAVALSPALRRVRWSPVVVLVPLLGVAAWTALAPTATSPAAQLQDRSTALPPALAVAVPALTALLTVAVLRAPGRPDRLAARLVLIAVLAALGAWLTLVELPRRLTGEPLLPSAVVALLVVPALLGCVVVAVDGRRLETVEPAVRRSLVRGLATLLVGALFLVLAAGVGSLSDVGVRSLLLGGVVALAVLPLAVLLQRGVRRLLYGDSELPRRVVSELRRLDVRASPEDALTETLALLARRLRLHHAAIDVPARDGAPGLSAAIGESRGRAVHVDLVAGGVGLGRLTLEVEPDRDPFGPGDRRLVEDVGAQVGALVQAVLANRELQGSRERLVTAREEERRRLRRDLHDGLGPSLAMLAMRLDEASELIPRDPERAAQLVEALSERARAEIGEVRRLVDGLRPPALDQLGLVSALRQRAAEHGGGDGTPGPGLTWTVVAGDVGPLPAAVEVAAYRIALEGVTNALRHSGADRCTVTLDREDAVLVVRVGDTGHGLAANPAAGVGLTSMRERAEELGGTCTVTSGPDGTVVEARLPVAVRKDG